MYSIRVCGKKPDVAAMQDLLVYVTKGLSAVTTELRFDGKEIEAYVNEMIIVNLFTTITNANFDKDSIIERIKNTLATKEELIRKVENREVLPEAALWKGTEADFEAKASRAGILSTENEDIRSLRELITYGLKGLAAYAKHAAALAHTDVEIDAFLQRALAATLDDSLSADQLTALTLETGSYGVKVMELLTKPIQRLMEIRISQKLTLGLEKIQESLFPGMIFVIWRCFWNRLRGQVWMFTHILRCFRHITIRLSRNIRTLSETMEMHGGNRKKNLSVSTVRF